jgi:hypothetical protein
MTSSLWPSQNASLSITQAAARLHIEHWMEFMVDLKARKKGCDISHPFFLANCTVSGR